MSDGPENQSASLAAAEIQRRAITGSLWTGIHAIVYLPVAFVANAIIARSLGVEGYGQLAFLTVALALAIPFANFGFASAVIQRGSRAEVRGRREESDCLLRMSLGFYLLAELPVLVVIAAVLTWGDPWWEVAAIGGVVLATCLFSGPALSITIENRTAVGAQMTMGINLVVQATAVSVALLTRSASAIWAVRSLVPALALGLNFLLLDPDRRRTIMKPLLPRALGRTFWSFALLSWAASLVALLVFSRSEIFLLRALDKPEGLGVFALAFGLSAQMTAPADALLHPLLPAIAGIVSSWPERALEAFDRSTRMSAVVCGGIAAVVVPALFFAIPVIYGEDFKPAAWLIVPLALASMFQSVNNPVTAFVNARERAGLRLRANTVALTLDVAVGLALIPFFGAWGAVAAAVVGSLVAVGWLAAAEPLLRGRGFIGILRLHRAFLVGIAAATAALPGGLVLQSWSATAATGGATCLGGFLYILGIRLTRSGLPAGDGDVLVRAMPIRLRSPVARILQPITLPTRP